MNSSQLTNEQASKLHEALFSHVNYLLRLQQRLEARQFPADDPLMVAATKAYQAVWELRQQVHSLSCRMRDRFNRPPA